MKHIRKIMSAILALMLVLTSNIVPAMACTVEYDGMEPKVIPCEQVAEKGYCDIIILHYGHIGGEMRPLVNPYYKDAPEVTETPVTMPIESEPVATEAPVETTPVKEQPFTDVTVTEVVPCKYDWVKDFDQDLAAVGVDPGEKVYSFLPIYRWGFIDKTGKEVVPPKYVSEYVPTFHEGLAAVNIGGNPYGRGGKWGFIDKTGKEVIPCKYDGAGSFSEGLAAVELDGKWGFIDKTGKEVVPLKYDGAGSFSEDLAAVRVDTGEKTEYGGTIYKWGFIDKTGKEVVPPKYDEVESFDQGLAAVKLDGKWGFVDKTGKEVVPCKYARVEDFDQGLAVVLIGVYPDYKWGFIDKTGKEVVPPKYDKVENFDQGLAAVRIGGEFDGKWGFIDKTGNEVVPCKYRNGFLAPFFSEGLAAVELDGKWGFIDKTGKEVVPCKYNYVASFSEGLAAVSGDGGRFFIDKTGKEVVPCKYDSARSFSEGLAMVSVGAYPDYKWGFIDKTGKEVVPCKYDEVKDFNQSLAAVFIGDNFVDGKWGFIDKTGTEVVPPKYDRVEDFGQGLTAVELDGKWGFIDKTGKEVMPCKYDEVRNFDQGFAAVKLDGKWGFISVSEAAAPVQTAKENVQTVKVDGKDVSFAMYSPDGGGTNYVRLVDLAVALNGTAGQYNVGYDGRVLLTSHTPYEGGTSTAPFHEPMAYTTLDEPTYVDGTAQKLEGIRFEYQGGGYTYYKLRDLGQALGFNVGWDNANQRIYIESNKPYDPNN